MPYDLARIRELAKDEALAAKAIADTAQKAGRALTEQEYSDAMAHVKAGQEYTLQYRLGTDNGGNPSHWADGDAFMSGDTGTRRRTSVWASDVAERMTKTAQAVGVKAVSSGSIDVPSVLRTDVAAFPEKPRRLTDLLGRQQLTSHSYAYLRQTVRTNAAAPVADLANKPVSTFTVAEITGNAEVIAHLSETVPERYLTDYASMTAWLETEMEGGVLDTLENQILNGTGVSPQLHGLDGLSGVQTVAWGTSLFATTRAAVTAMALADEQPTSWVLHPSDIQLLDLATDANTDFYRGGPNTTGLAAPLWSLPIVASRNVRQGVAYIGDWTQGTVLVREDAHLDVDRSGALFTSNSVRMRYEGRFAIEWFRPSAFAKVALNNTVVL